MKLSGICLWCFNSGHSCKVCGHVAPRKKVKSKAKTKANNPCTCRKDEYCHVCRSDKIKKEGEEAYSQYLLITFIKLKKFQMSSCGEPETDHIILQRHGPWMDARKIPSIALIAEAEKLQRNPI